jgi:predicted HicB family RNase H-like nuclease
MKRIIDGKSYDTETAGLVAEAWSPVGGDGAKLYQTRHGAYFLWAQFLTPSDNTVQELRPLSDDEAQKWLEQNANHLVEEHFGAMLEGGAAERRLTLRLPNNLAKRLDAIAQARRMSLNRYVTRCLERCAAEDGKPTTVV